MLRENKLKIDPDPVGQISFGVINMVIDNCFVDDGTKRDIRRLKEKYGLQFKIPGEAEVITRGLLSGIEPVGSVGYSGQTARVDMMTMNL